MLTYQRFYFICHTGCCVTSLSPWWNDYNSLLCFPNCLVFSLALYVLDTKSKFTKNCSLQHGTGCKWQCSVNCCLNLLRSDSWNARTLPRLMLGQAHKARSTGVHTIFQQECRQLRPGGGSLSLSVLSGESCFGLPVYCTFLFYLLVFNAVVKGACAQTCEQTQHLWS